MDEPTRHDSCAVAQVIADALEDIMARWKAAGRNMQAPPVLVLCVPRLQIIGHFVSVSC